MGFIPVASTDRSWTSHGARRRGREAATQLMEAEVGSLLLIDEEKSHLYFEVALGDQEETIKKITLNIGEGIAGWVAQKGDPLIVNAPEKDPRFFKGVDERTEFKPRNIICVSFKRLNLLPMRSKSGILIRVDIPGGLRCTVWPRQSTSR